MTGITTDGSFKAGANKDFTRNTGESSDVFVSPQGEEVERLVPCQLRRSSSDLGADAHSRYLNSIRVRFAGFPRSDDLHARATKDVDLPLRLSDHVPGSLRPSSKAGLGSISYEDPVAASAMLRQQLLEQTRQTRQSPAQPWRVRRSKTTSGPFDGPDLEVSAQLTFTWSPFRGSSEPSTPAPGRESRKKPGTISPLKPCIKQKPKSAAAMPLNEGETETQSEEIKLRRVKTVDFEDTLTKPLLAVNPLKGLEDAPKAEPARPPARKQVPQQAPLSLFTSRGRPADAAVTQTDVHVVAIAPSWDVDESPNESGEATVTPTMAKVESSEGSYQVVWDDITPEHEDSRRERCSSSADVALRTAMSSPQRALERVNTKLTEWSWGKSSPEPFKPQIVVFPDDDGRVTRSECVVDEDGIGSIIAPPNSERTSGIPSRQASQPASARMSERASQDDNDVEPLSKQSQPQEKEDPLQEGLVVPNPEASAPIPGSRIGASRGLKRPQRPPSYRRLSNMDESDMKFRGHRDSVALAQSHVVKPGGISPELFMHRDSVFMAKKRMHAKNHATSAAREIPHAIATASPCGLEVDDINDQPLSPERKQEAVINLKNSKSTSMLSPQANDARRHIRILD